MSLRTKLAWAFVLVALMAVILAVVGVNVGMYTATLGPPRGMGMGGMGMGQGMGQMMGRGGGPMMMNGRTVMENVVRWSLISSLVGVLLAGAAGYWTAGRITDSLRRLRDAAGRLGLRDLSLRVPEEGRDEIAQLGQAFNRMGERLQAEERTRRQLLADVAHELRHPLAVLQGRLELMQDGVVALEPEAIVPLQDEVIRLTRLVGDLRDLSLAEVGGLSLRRASVDLPELLESLRDNLEPVAAAKSVELETRIPEDLPAIQADPDRIRQVFLNLLTNALHYTPEGGLVRVEAGTKNPGKTDPGKTDPGKMGPGKADAGGEAVWVRVCDTGPGIPPEDLPRIFDRFYRADRSRSRATGGSGLGLAIVRSLVELHGGQVTAASTVGQGTCMTVTLPLRPPAMHAAHAPATSSNP